MRVYSVVGVPPEIQAYAMARYSRSSQSMLESIGELSAQRAEQFLNTFYFQYGHRSIADLAHLVLAVEDVSILAAIRVVDEPLWDGQERSTRYQSFAPKRDRAAANGSAAPPEAAERDLQATLGPSGVSERPTPSAPPIGYFVPPEILGSPAEARFRAAADELFAAYERQTKALTDVLKRVVGRPDDLDPQTYQRTLRARALDVTRGLLPLATLTSVGQVVSARVLERQISRLLADPFPEVRQVGAELRAACQRPAEAPTLAKLRALAPDGAASELLEPPAAAPTLVKHTQPNRYPQRTWAELAPRARELLGDPPDRRQPVELGEPCDPETDLLATLLYRADPAGHSFRQCQAAARRLAPEERQELLALSVRHRGPHDELLREHAAGQPLAFDLLLDLGAFRDLHRHRRCVQVIQELTPEHGFWDVEWAFAAGLTPAGAELARAAGLVAEYRAALERAGEAARALWAEQPLAAPYLLPLAARCRALFKMDLAEAAYIIELRTGPTGHFAYREAAWRMYEALRERLPAFAALVRATDPRAVVDLLRR